jgi:RNA polymerase sigma-70 factor, ECF subfamily
MRRRLRSRCTAGRYNRDLERQLEVELARALAAGEPRAFERFVEHFRSKIFHYSWLICGQRDDAEEVAQETLLKVFESFDQLREPERVRAWVFRIARNACLMQRRTSVFAPRHELSMEDLPPGSEIEDPAVSLPDDQLAGGELRALLDRVIAELPPAYRPVVLLRDLEELSTEETAEVLDLSTDVVKTRLHRARIAMRQKLDCYLNNHCIDVEPIASPSPLSECAWDDLRQAWRSVTGVTAATRPEG